MSGALPSFLLTDLAILLHDMLSRMGNESRVWLRNALSTVPTGILPHSLHLSLYLSLSLSLSRLSLSRLCSLYLSFAHICVSHFLSISFFFSLSLFSPSHSLSLSLSLSLSMSLSFFLANYPFTLFPSIFVMLIVYYCVLFIIKIIVYHMMYVFAKNRDK